MTSIESSCHRLDSDQRFPHHAPKEMRSRERRRTRRRENPDRRVPEYPQGLRTAVIICKDHALPHPCREDYSELTCIARFREQGEEVLLFEGGKVREGIDNPFYPAIPAETPEEDRNVTVSYPPLLLQQGRQGERDYAVEGCTTE